MSIGQDNLRRILADSTTEVSGSVAADPAPTTTTCTLANYDFATTVNLAGNDAIFRSATGTRQVTKITGNVGPQLTFSALAVAPSPGDTVTINPRYTINVTPSDNIAQWAGTGVAAPVADDADGVATVGSGIPRYFAELWALGASGWQRLKALASGALQTRDDATSATGASAPSVATLVGGTDGTDLRALATDATGVAKAQGAYTEAAPGTAAPSHALLVGGTDGTDLRALATETTGEIDVYKVTKQVPSNLADVFNTAVSAATNILSTSLALSSAYSGSATVMRIQVTLSAAADFNVMMTQGTTTVTLTQNGGNALAAGAEYRFDRTWTYGQTINFQVSAAVTVLSLQVDQVDAAA